nr:uncharacterized protein LOC116769517 [Danaus plexippus plexippus]
MACFLLYSIILYFWSVTGKSWYPARDHSEVLSGTDLKYAEEGHSPNYYTNGNISSKNFKDTEQIQRLSTNKQKTIELYNVIKSNNWLNITRPRRKIRRCLPRSRYSKYREFSPQGRFLEVFEVVQFEHLPCTSHTGLEGTCLHEIDCVNQGGTGMGSCADGFGTCCIVIFNCEARSNSRVGWFTNPGFPSPSSERLSCVFTLDKHSDNIKQIRLDFMNFELLPPSYGNCEQDQFTVTAQNANFITPTLCGINSGQHVYVEVSKVEGPLIFSMQTITDDARLYSIKITQLTAWDELAAPTGCRQFFKGDQGYLESFNYRERSEIGILRSSSYMNNFNYAMCIERAPNSCSVTYTNDGEMQIVNYDTDGIPVIPPQQAGVEIFNCPTDYLLIAAVRLCGERFNDGSVLQDFSLDAPVTDDSAGPIVIRFRSDGIYTGRGFKLHYQQNSCTK